MYFCFFLMVRRPPRTTRSCTLFPYQPPSRSVRDVVRVVVDMDRVQHVGVVAGRRSRKFASDTTKRHDRDDLAVERVPGVHVVEIVDLIRDCPRCLVVRSEEHTSELQSLMRISYAVFCLKKKQRKLNQRT